MGAGDKEYKVPIRKEPEDDGKEVGHHRGEIADTEKNDHACTTLALLSEREKRGTGYQRDVTAQGQESAISGTDKEGGKPSSTSESMKKGAVTCRKRGRKLQGVSCGDGAQRQRSWGKREHGRKSEKRKGDAELPQGKNTS